MAQCRVELGKLHSNNDWKPAAKKVALEGVHKPSAHRRGSTPLVGGGQPAKQAFGPGAKRLKTRLPGVFRGGVRPAAQNRNVFAKARSPALSGKTGMMRALWKKG